MSLHDNISTDISFIYLYPRDMKISQWRTQTAKNERRTYNFQFFKKGKAIPVTGLEGR
jgi:hypothetical protein